MNLVRRELYLIAVLIGVVALLVTVPVSVAADFNDNCNLLNVPPPCDDVTPSLASFSVYVRFPYHGMMVGYPGYDPVTHILQSPTLFESATVIGRSAAHMEGSPADINGTPVGSSGVMISDSDFLVVPPGFEVTGGREVHLEIVQLMMSNFGGGAAVRAGATPFGLWLSPGEVESQSASGVPANDFPGDGFFNVFVEIDLPVAGAFPGATLYNPSPADLFPARPLVVLAPNEMAFPPSVIYVHGQTSAVPVRFRFSSPGNWPANALFGWLRMAGHMTNVLVACAEPGTCPVGAIPWCCEACGVVDDCCCPMATDETAMLDEMAAGGEMEYPSCGNGVYEPENEEQCDNGDDAQCPGRCLPDCTCEVDIIPTVSEWGLIVMTLLAFTAGTVLYGRRRIGGIANSE